MSPSHEGQPAQVGPTSFSLGCGVVLALPIFLLGVTGGIPPDALSLGFLLAFALGAGLGWLVYPSYKEANPKPQHTYQVSYEGGHLLFPQALSSRGFLSFEEGGICYRTGSPLLLSKSRIHFQMPYAQIELGHGLAGGIGYTPDIRRVLIRFVDDRGATHEPQFGAIQTQDLEGLMRDLYSVAYLKEPPVMRPASQDEIRSSPS